MCTYTPSTLLLVVSLICASAVQCDVTPANESDYGKLVLRNVGNDANIYFLHDTNVISRVHWVMPIVKCECAGLADVHKKTQLDYLVFTSNILSYAVYVNDHSSGGCTLNALDIQLKTSLMFNQLGALHNVYTDFSGPILYRAMSDFFAHSYVKKHQDEVVDFTKDGGVMFSRSTLFMRPCNIMPMYLPWMLEGEAIGNKTIVISLSDSCVGQSGDFDGITAAELDVFCNVVLKLQLDNIIDNSNFDTLQTNTGSPNIMHSFHWSALFVPFKHIPVFMQILEPFSKTAVSPDIYIPFIFQIMWTDASWSRLQSDNTTMYAVDDSLLRTCDGKTAVDSLNNVNSGVASDLVFFASWCGTYISVDYIIRSMKHFVAFHFFRAMFYIFVSILLFLMVCVYRRTIAGACGAIYGCCRAKLGKCYKRCTRSVGYTKLNASVNDVQMTSLENSMSDLPDDINPSADF